MEPFNGVYHNTSLANKDEIVEGGHLMHGTHFTCTLYQGGLPTISPHGTERIQIPIRYIMKLFASPRLFLRKTADGRRNKTYYNLVLTDDINLVLVERENDEIQECNITENQYVILDKDGDRFQVKRNSGDGTSKWVNLRIDKEIPLIPHEWTTMQ
ncbi:uncharacterized protein LOC123543536 [Mercenaria mercenaria]|uniref:uncharacterized protein LOC123543536 n=1 Tax=Mercenaria mercenaria TaxID=6596 RepID=UPI00234ECB21|nr:uncharacterized protein LOC123543536 [Mercenaria mercenaria]